MSEGTWNSFVESLMNDLEAARQEVEAAKQALRLANAKFEHIVETLEGIHVTDSGDIYQEGEI